MAWWLHTTCGASRACLAFCGGKLSDPFSSLTSGSSLQFIPLPFDLTAFAMAPQSIVTALTGVTIVLVQVFAPWALGEKVTHLDWVATMIIVAGASLPRHIITIYGHISLDSTPYASLPRHPSSPHLLPCHATLSPIYARCAPPRYALPWRVESWVACVAAQGVL